MRELAINIFGVGDGDCVLIEFPSGELGVIDARKPAWLSASPVSDALRRRVTRDGSCRVAFVCASHPHYDHVHALHELISIPQLTIDEFWHTLPDLEEALLSCPPELASEYPGWSEVLEFYYEDQIGAFLEFAKEMIARVGGERTRAVRGMQALPDIGGVQIVAINPTHRASKEYGKGLFESAGRLEHLDRSLLDCISAAFIFVFGKHAFLYASDMQADQWVDVLAEVRQRSNVNGLLPASAMKASHHGGARSYFDGLWREVLGTRGDLIVVSAGSAIHPDKSFLESAHKAEKQVFCTGLATVCGRRSPGRRPSVSWSEDWLERYSEAVDVPGNGCCGDLRVVIPEGEEGLTITCGSGKMRTCGRGAVCEK